MSERTGLYPGTFDPFTKGHLDIVQRAIRVVDHLIIAVAANDGKRPLFGTRQRVKMAEREVAHLNGAGKAVQVVPFDNLLINFAHEMGATLIVRGLRAVSDFEYEFQMAGMNVRLDPKIETVFLMASERHQFVSSRFVKEIAKLGGDVTSFVSEEVAAALKTRLAARS